MPEVMKGSWIHNPLRKNDVRAWLIKSRIYEPCADRELDIVSTRSELQGLPMTVTPVARLSLLVCALVKFMFVRVS
jgi:hypothetical protein